MATDEQRNGSRSSMVSIRLAPEEQEALKAAASENGVSLSQFVRRLLLQRSDPHGSVTVESPGTTTTAVGVGFAIEERNGQLLPSSATPYVSNLTPQ